MDGNIRTIRVPLSFERWAELSVPVPLSEEEWGRLLTGLESVMKPGLVQSAEPPGAVAPSPGPSAD